MQLPRNGPVAAVLLPEAGDGHPVFRLKLLIVRLAGFHLLTLQVVSVAPNFLIRLFL
jgi:hypothetical protein